MGFRFFQYLGKGIYLTGRITTMTFGYIIYCGLCILGLLGFIALIYSLT